MSQAMSTSDVLTLEDAAEYLQLPQETVEREAARGEIPGRRIDGSWRFLRRALLDWLGRDSRSIALRQVGALRDDDSVEELLASIYRARGRPEVDEEALPPCTSSTPTP